MPVKWTTPPRVLIFVPPSAVTRACQAAHPRLSACGSSIASRHPGAGTASGFSRQSSSPVAVSAPRLQAAQKPRFSPVSITFAPGASSAATSALRSTDPLSTTISSSPSRSCAPRAGRVAPRASAELKLTITTESELTVGTPYDWGA